MDVDCSPSPLEETQRILDFVSCAPCIPFAIGDSIECEDLYSPPTVRLDNETVPFPLKDASILLSKGTAATFGLGSKEVLDLEYRNALRFDTSEFAPSFHPSEWPELVQKIRTSLFVEGNIRIERYRMNVYSVGGMFKAHKDTPKTRGTAKHIASLVVCLPSAFEGGTLHVKGSRKGKEQNVAFDWSKKASMGDCLQWAAFFADSPHYIEPVKSGNRVTITYDIFEEPLFEPIRPCTTGELIVCGQTVGTKDRLAAAKYVPIDEYPVDCQEHRHFIYFCEHQYSDADSHRGHLRMLNGNDALMCKLLSEATGCTPNVVSGEAVTSPGFDNFEPSNYEWCVSEFEDDTLDTVSAIAVNSPVFILEQETAHYGNGPGPSEDCYRPAVMVFCTKMKIKTECNEVGSRSPQ